MLILVMPDDIPLTRFKINWVFYGLCFNSPCSVFMSIFSTLFSSCLVVRREIMSVSSVTKTDKRQQCFTLHLTTFNYFVNIASTLSSMQTHIVFSLNCCPFCFLPLHTSHGTAKFNTIFSHPG